MSLPNPLPKLAYSVAEVCHLIGLGRTGVFKEIREQRLRAVKAGRRTLIPAVAIQAWLDRLASVAIELEPRPDELPERPFTPPRNTRPSPP